MTITIGDNCDIHPSVIFTNGQLRGVTNYKGSVIIGKNVRIGAYTVINIGERGCTIIGDNVSIGNLCNIGHNTHIHDDVEIGAGCVISGHVVIGKRSQVKIGCTLRNRIRIGNNTVIGMGSNVVKDCDPESVYYGNPCEKSYER
jgi:UDP-3-O-[3-hydroxymyristoyl] glucosamine N-acyltransferase